MTRFLLHLQKLFPRPLWRGLDMKRDMAFPVRPVFTPFVVVVGGKYFLPVPECLLFDQENLKCT